MANNVVRFSDIIVDSLKFGEVTQSKTGGKMVNITHNNKVLIFQTPKLAAPGGAREFFDKTQPDKLQSIVLNGSLGRGEEPAVQAFADVIEAFEQRVLAVASERSKEWFGDSFTEAEFKKSKMFKSQIRRDEEGKYPPSLQMKFLYYDGRCQTKCYDTNRNAVDYHYIGKGSRVEAIVEVKSVWIIDNKFGVSFKVLQCRAEKNQKIDDYAFIEAEEESDETYQDY